MLFRDLLIWGEYMSLILDGAHSLGLTIAAGIAGFMVAFLLALLRFKKIPVLDRIAAGYIDFIRNTPLIVQLFFIAFGLPMLFGYVWPFWCHALLALTINFSGYFAEILRSGFASTQKGQLEAAAALNLRNKTVFGSIIVPQTLIKMFPSSSQFIFLFLTTGVISEIGVEDLTHAGLYIDSRTFRSFEVFIILTALYVAIAIFLKASLHFVFFRGHWASEWLNGRSFVEILGKPHGFIVFQLLAACRFTIYLSLIAFVGGGAIACLITLLRISKISLQGFATTFIWVFQSIPLLMLLFLIGLGMPRLLDVNVDPWTAATFALVLFTAAYLAEVWRGAIESVARGQWEASYALNIRYSLLLRDVILPQAIKFGVAPTIGFMVQIIKGTSLAYIIGFNDLMLVGKRWANAPVLGSEPFIIFPLMAVMYFCICYPLALFARKLEAKSLTKS